MKNVFEYISMIGALKETVSGTMASGKDFCISEVTRFPLIGSPFKVHEYGCFICLQGESDGSVDLMPYHLKKNSMMVNVPGQLMERHSITPDFKGVYIVMSSEFISGLGLPYNFQLYRRIREVPIVELHPMQLKAMLTYKSGARIPVTVVLR